MRKRITKEELLQRLQMLPESASENEVYLDIQGLGSYETIAELLAKAAAGIFLVYFTVNELRIELRKYRKLSKKDGHGS